jgi:hypothetical protein
VVKRILTLVGVAALVVAVPAWAAKPTHPTHPSHPAHAKGAGDGKGHDKGSCKTVMKGYRASGALVSATLTPGAKKDRFDGSLTVDVSRANHKSPQGSQTFTLADARVRFGKGITSTTTAAGDRVTLHGKVTALTHKCSSTTFTPVVTVRNLRISAPKP